jgi:phenylalanyl-tRNA synthetase beta chain
MLQWGRKEQGIDFFDVKGDVEALLAPLLAQAPVMFELELDAVLQRVVPQFQPVAKHQAVERDLAVVVASGDPCRVMAAGGVGCARRHCCAAVLFDVYRPKRLGKAPPQVALWLPDEKSLAVRLTWVNSDEATLTEAEIEAAVQAVVTQLTPAPWWPPARLMLERRCPNERRTCHGIRS